MENDKRNDLEDRLVAFAVTISALIEALPLTASGKYIAGQLIRSEIRTCSKFRNRYSSIRLFNESF
jgi:hypothetical protein